MAYLPEFKNDVFISYRRAIDEGPDRWVESFEKALKLQLKQLVGDGVLIWRDKEQLLTGDDWRRCLVDALEGAAIYLAIISRTYLDSRECRNELDLMLARLRDDQGKVPRKIFPVYKQPPKSEADVPPELQRTQRREFFERRDDAPLGFSEIDASSEDREFQQRLAWLAQELTVALERLRGDSLQRFAGHVFVADVEPGLYRDRDSLGADLLHHRWLVSPEHEYLWSEPDIEQTIRADLHDAMLSVHLVTPVGLQSEAEVAQARQQLQLAVEVMHERGRPPPLVWISTKAGASERLLAFIQEIEGPFADQGVEVLVGGLEEMKSLIYKRLPQPAAPAAAPAGTDLAVLVEDADFEAFAATRAHLMDAFDLETVPVRLAAGAARDASALQQALASCTRCLVYWGTQNEDWLQQVLRLPPLAGHLGRERLCVLAAAPVTPEKTLFVTKKAQLVRAGDNADAELRAFFGSPAAATT